MRGNGRSHGGRCSGTGGSCCGAGPLGGGCRGDILPGGQR